MREAREMLDERSPRGLRVWQVTEDEAGAGLIYPDQPSFLAGGRRFVYNTPEGAHVCDLDEGGALRPLLPPDRRKWAVKVHLDGSAVTLHDGHMVAQNLNVV